MNSTRIYKPGSSTTATASNVVNPEPHETEEKTLPFPLEHLPPAVREMAEAIARTERTPETLAGCCVLGILSASIGAGLQIKSGPNRMTRGNIYLLASAESGSGKSETFRHAVKPLQEFERETVEHWRMNVKPKADAEKAISDSRISQLKKDSGRAKDSIEREDLRIEMVRTMADSTQAEANCHAPAFCVEDATSEKLAVMLGHNQEQLASISPDAGSIVNNLLGRYSKLDRTDESIYLKAFSGDYCRVDRQGREPVLLQRPCLSALWLVQPDKIETLLGKSELTDGGLIPRLLVCHTKCQPLPIEDDPEEMPAAVVNAWALLVGKLIKTFRLAGEPFTVQPTPEARQLMNDYFNRIVKLRLGQLQDVSTFAARWSEQAWRIAACLHAGLHCEDAGGRLLSANTAESAIAIADWFAGEQLKILASGRHAARQAKRDKVLGLLAEKPMGVRASDVYHVRIAGNAKEAHALLESLESEGVLTGNDSRPDHGGHVTRTFTKAQQ